MRQALFFISIIIATTQLTAQDAVEAKTWLKTTIKEYFEQFPSTSIDQIATKQYSEYRQDAICVAYDCENSLTPEEFKQKWSSTYDVTFAGIGESFLIGQQDWGNVVMSKCEMTYEPEQGTYIFDTIVEDTMFKLSYSIEIIVKKTDKGFKIDDVKKREI